MKNVRTDSQHEQEQRWVQNNHDYQQLCQVSQMITLFITELCMVIDWWVPAFPRAQQQQPLPGSDHTRNFVNSNTMISKETSSWWTLYTLEQVHFYLRQACVFIKSEWISCVQCQSCAGVRLSIAWWSNMCVAHGDLSTIVCANRTGHRWVGGEGGGARITHYLLQHTVVLAIKSDAVPASDRTRARNVRRCLIKWPIYNSTSVHADERAVRALCADIFDCPKSRRWYALRAQMNVFWLWFKTILCCRLHAILDILQTSTRIFSF